MAWERPGTIYLKPAMEIVADKLGISYKETWERFGPALAGKEIAAFAFDEVNDYFSELPFSLWRDETSWNGAWFSGELTFVSPKRDPANNLISMIVAHAFPLLARPHPAGPAWGKVMLVLVDLENWISVQLKRSLALTTEPVKLIELQAQSDKGEKKKKKRPRGRSYMRADEILIQRMHELITGGTARNPNDAARAVVSDAAGAGTNESKVKRLASKYIAKYSD